MARGNVPRMKEMELRDLTDFDRLLQPQCILYIDTTSNHVNEVVRDKIFIGRVLVDPYRKEAITFVAEDPKGRRTIRVLLYNNPFALSMFYVGAIFVIANPCFRASTEGIAQLVSDDPNYFTFISYREYDYRFPDLKWKPMENQSHAGYAPDYRMKLELQRLRAEGNSHFASKEYPYAIMKYTMGLQLNPKDETLLCNRALCYFQCCHYKKALKFASLCLEINPRHIKAIYTVAKAYTALKRYEEARELLENKLNTGDSPNRHLEKLLVFIKKLIAQRDFGKYDMVEFLRSYIRSETTFHEIADYVGQVEVKDVDLNKGRGLVLTEDVKPGTLLLCSKPYAMVSGPLSRSYTDAIDKLSNHIAKIVKTDLESARELYQLSAGRQLGYLKPNDDLKVDLERIKGIVTINMTNVTSVYDVVSVFGLWLMRSYINSDCFNFNCSSTVYGNVLQIRSLKHLKKGEELLLPYNRMLESLSSRNQHALNLGYVCDCALCQYERQEPINKLETREKLLSFFHQSFFEIKNTEVLDDIISKVKNLSVNSPFLDHYLFRPRFRLAEIHYRNSNYDKTIEVLEELLNSWEKSGIHDLVEVCIASLKLFECYVFKKEYANAIQSRKKLFENFNLAFGTTDKALMELLCSEIGRLLNLLDIHSRIEELAG